jgi:hypothetical protein
MSTLKVPAGPALPEPVRKWRLERLKQAGYPPDEALALSGRPDVDLHFRRSPPARRLHGADCTAHPAVNPSFTSARIAGIRIGANWSWLIVFALIVWTLESGVFPTSNPGLSKAAYLAMAIAAALLFFASLLLHEPGHALQAKREGVEIEGITLWLFGGIARFKARSRPRVRSCESRSPARSSRARWSLRRCRCRGRRRVGGA